MHRQSEKVQGNIPVLTKYNNHNVAAHKARTTTSTTMPAAAQRTNTAHTMTPLRMTATCTSTKLALLRTPPCRLTMAIPHSVSFGALCVFPRISYVQCIYVLL
jgi:hypothetical protein